MIDIIMYGLARLAKKMRPSAVRSSTIHKTSALEAGCQFVGSSMGRHSYCGYDCVVIEARIGSFCSISDNVVIGGSQHPMHFVSTSPVFLAHRDSVKTKFARHQYKNIPVTTIGHDVWIGRSAIIKSGITIGVGAVVGMGSVVTKDVPAYAVVAGNPAKLLKYRFAEEQVAALLRSEWWTRNDAELTELGALCNDPEKFFDFEQRKL